MSCFKAKIKPLLKLFSRSWRDKQYSRCWFQQNEQFKDDLWDISIPFTTWLERACYFKRKLSLKSDPKRTTLSILQTYYSRSDTIRLIQHTSLWSHLYRMHYAGESVPNANASSALRSDDKNGRETRQAAARVCVCVGITYASDKDMPSEHIWLFVRVMALNCSLVADKTWNGDVGEEGRKKRAFSTPAPLPSYWYSPRYHTSSFV